MYSHHEKISSASVTKLQNPCNIRLKTNAYSIGEIVQYKPLNKYSFNIEEDNEEEGSEPEEGEIQESKHSPILEQNKPLLFEEFIKQKSSHIFRTKSGQLVPHAFKLDDMIIYTRDKLNIDDRDYNSNTIKIDWKYRDGIKLRVCLNYVETIAIGDDTSNLYYLRSLNTIIRHKASCNLLNFGQTFFWPAAKTDSKHRINMDSMLDCAFGIYLSGIMLTKRGPAVILDHTAAALTKSENLINLFESFRRDDITKYRQLKKSRTLEPLQFLDLTDHILKNFCSTVLGLKCYINHMKHKQTFRIKKFTQSSANSTKFRWNEEDCDVTISEYFFRKHSIRLRYPNLPCLVKGNDERQAMYPFELCYLLEDQKIRKSRLTPIFSKRLDQTKESPITDISPDKRSEYSQETNSIFNHLSMTYMQSFGLELSNRPLIASGRMIDPPTLQYRDDKMMVPKDGRWKAQKFLTSLSMNYWCVVNTSKTTGIDQVRSFVEGFRNYSFIYFGLSMNTPDYKDISVKHVDEQAIRAVVSECMRECPNEDRPQLILFVVNENNELYSCIHYVSDILFGIKATCIHDKNIRPTSNPGEVRMRFSTPVMTNLSQKINAKLGGINMRNVSTTESSIYNNDLLNAMFVGCDVTHPDSNTSDASIAACVASCSSDFFQYITSIRVQKRKNDEIVQSIGEMMEELLCTYKIKNGNLPSKIFLYRDGVSDDQFEQVKQLEINKLEDFFSKIYTSERCSMPSLTFVVVQKRHRMRFFEESSSHHLSCVTLKNPRPGTVVDDTVTSPKEEDFYLYSHWNNKGTSRPSHYHVIRNDSGYTMDKLQKITFFMCHTYARCSQSISLPAVVRYAHLAAYRARVLLMSAKNSIKTKASSSSNLLDEPQDNLDDMIKPNSLLRDTMYFC